MTANDTASDLIGRCLRCLARWLPASETHWEMLNSTAGHGVYGTGYNSWGVQTNQKYLSALAVLSALGPTYGIAADIVEQARARALAALRFSLASHRCSGGACTDGTPWGETWISSLGVERMMHALPLLAPDLTAADQDALAAMLQAEAVATLHGSDHFGRPTGVVGDPWNSSGRNVPESNLWNGALLWRVSRMYPDHPEAAAFAEQARLLLINSVSIPADADEPAQVDGLPVRERFRGANFFADYALDHHGYMNVGYMVICVSNAAMLHFDMRALGHAVPEALHHHQSDLWQVVRRLIFADGRLCRIGGDSRVRYSYCQEYLLPSLAYAADRGDEPFAAPLLAGQLGWTEQEQGAGDTDHFYRPRLSLLAANPYYFTRLESDRACVLGMLACYLHQNPDCLAGAETAAPTFEASVSGGWADLAHGDVVHRCPSRIAAFSWRAHGYAQGMCLPPDDGHLAEWQRNLGGHVRCLGDSGLIDGGNDRHRQLRSCGIGAYDGGFVTAGRLAEGHAVQVAEGWRADDQVSTYLAVAALPDGHTLVGIHLATANDRRVAVLDTKSLHLNIPNDLFNSGSRQLETASGVQTLAERPTAAVVCLHLQSRWACVDGCLGAVGIYGADELTLLRYRERRGGKYESLHVEELCWHGVIGPARMFAPGAVILDTAWAVLAQADADCTERFAATAERLDADDGVRAVRVHAVDGRAYVFAANVGPGEATLARLGATLAPGAATVVCETTQTALGTAVIRA
jgi:hypothetical protein